MSQEPMIWRVADVPEWRGTVGRVGDFSCRTVLIDTGKSGVRMELTHTVFDETYFTPRHRHSFDQIRYILARLIHQKCPEGLAGVA